MHPVLSFASAIISTLSGVVVRWSTSNSSISVAGVPGATGASGGVPSVGPSFLLGVMVNCWSPDGLDVANGGEIIPATSGCTGVWFISGWLHLMGWKVSVCLRAEELLECPVVPHEECSLHQLCPNYQGVVAPVLLILRSYLAFQSPSHGGPPLYLAPCGHPVDVGVSGSAR